MGQVSESLLIERIKKQTNGIQISRTEGTIANFLLPHFLVDNIFSKYSFSEMSAYDLNVLGYKRLLRIIQKHKGILPERLKSSYFLTPCGIAKLCAYKMREIFL